MPIGTNANGAVARTSIIAADRKTTEQTEEIARRNTALKHALMLQASQRKVSHAEPIRPIPPLGAVWIQQAAELAKFGIRQTPETPVCCSTTGGFINISNFERWWRSFRDGNGFEGLRFHELRHTRATLLLGSGVDVKTVQARLGHADASITLNWYAHAMPGNDRQAADLLAAIMEHPEKAARTA